MSYYSRCCLCYKEVDLLVKGWYGRGRFSYRTGGLCKECFKKAKKRFDNKEDFLLWLEKEKQKLKGEL